MTKTDLAKQYKNYYTAKAKPETVQLQAAQYLAIAGQGDPDSPEFANAIQALYGTAYTLKFMCKAEGNDFVVAKLEGQWWFDEKKYGGVGMADAPQKIPRSEWLFRLLIRLPDFVTKQQLEQAKRQAFEKNSNSLIEAIEWFEMPARKVAHILHVGPFNKEPETLAVLKKYMDEHQMKHTGHHHEIYLSDFRKTAPEKLRTILREEVE